MFSKLPKILMVAAEVTPLAKVGGLADVIASLPPALQKLGLDVRIIIPFYGSIKKAADFKKIFSEVKIYSAGKIKNINIWQTKLPGQNVLIYLIEEKEFFSAQKIYFGNNSERFLFFSLACLQILPLIKFQPDIIHCHDFHTALMPNLIKASLEPRLIKIKTLYTIHNLNYQGKSETEVLSTGNLCKNSLKSLTRDARNGDINFMVQGIINADLVNTVSPTYAKEIKTSVYGAGLENIIRQFHYKISGILNGIDIEKYNPITDKSIKQNYSPKTLELKVYNKLALQRLLKLPPRKDTALVGFVSRLAWQKGIELITSELCQLDCQFVFLGTGQKHYEDQLRRLARKFKDKIKTVIKFDDKLSKQIFAGADIFLMPSRFEPCGLAQMFSMRYGTIPLVRATGGLADTVNKKVGFSFEKYSSASLKNCLAEALKVYYQKPRKWKKLQKNCLKKDFSWNKSAQQYLKLYKKII